MLDRNDPEDRQILALLLAAGCTAFLAFLGFVIIISVMVSLNFNPLNWME